MSIFTCRPVLRWAVPVAVLVAMIGGGATARTLTASAATSPSTPSPAQLLTDLQNARNQPVSGTVVERADLGLPAPVASDGGSSNLRSLLSGSHTLRVWYAGPAQSRVALIGTLGETDVIRNGSDLWVWDSQKNTAWHKMLGGGAGQSPGMTQTPSASGTESPSPPMTTSGVADVKTPHPSKSPSRAALIQTPGPGGGETPTATETPSESMSPSEMPSASASAMTPQEVSNRIIAKLQPYTDISTRGPVTIANRTANELVLVPRDTKTLVARVTLAVDAQRHVPLRARIYARNYATPAFETAFTQINFTPPNPAQFNFTPPPGATVKQAKPHHAPPGAQRPTVVGKGWSSIIVAKMPPRHPSATGSETGSPSATGTETSSPYATGPETASPQTGTTQPGTPPASPSGGKGLQIENLPRVSGAWGSGHLLSSRLFNILFTDDGRVIAGAVPPQMLYAAAAR